MNIGIKVSLFGVEIPEIERITKIVKGLKKEPKRD